MLECLVSLLIVVIVALIILWVIEAIITAIGVTPPPPIIMLLRLLVALMVLIYALQCLGILRDFPIGPRHAVAGQEPGMAGFESTTTSSSSSMPMVSNYCVQDRVYAWLTAHPDEEMPAAVLLQIYAGCGK